MTQNPVHAKKKEDGKKFMLNFIWQKRSKAKQKTEEEKKIQVRLKGLKA